MTVGAQVNPVCGRCHPSPPHNPHRSHALEQALTELTARAHTLSCQAAAAAAKSAGARGLQAGEEARARAAAAEAEGLRVRLHPTALHCCCCWAVLIVHARLVVGWPCHSCAVLWGMRALFWGVLSASNLLLTTQHFQTSRHSAVQCAECCRLEIWSRSLFPEECGRASHTHPPPTRSDCRLLCAAASCRPLLLPWLTLTPPPQLHL